MTPAPVRIDDLPRSECADAGRRFRRVRLARHTAAADLGCSYYELEPGERSFRPHYHTANEEAVYVLDGEGTIHLGHDGEAHALLPGTYVALPRGPAGTHEVAADGEEPLWYLVFSTMRRPEVLLRPADAEALVLAPGVPGMDGLAEPIDLAPPAVDVDELPEPGELLVRSEAVAWTDYEPGERTFRRRQLGRAAGSEALGCSTYAVPAGSTTWLRHWHGANEEALYVLEGSGTLRLGEGPTDHGVEAGQYVALPADERGTHEVTAGADGLRYLVASEMVEPEVTCYPDRDMLGVYVGSATGGNPEERSVSAYLDRNAELEYWDHG